MDKFGDFVERLVYLLFGLLLIGTLAGATILIWTILVKALIYG